MGSLSRKKYWLYLIGYILLQLIWAAIVGIIMFSESKILLYLLELIIIPFETFVFIAGILLIYARAKDFTRNPYIIGLFLGPYLITYAPWLLTQFKMIFTIREGAFLYDYFFHKNQSYVFPDIVHFSASLITLLFVIFLGIVPSSRESSRI